PICPTMTLHSSLMQPHPVTHTHTHTHRHTHAVQCCWPPFKYVCLSNGQKSNSAYSNPIKPDHDLCQLGVCIFHHDPAELSSVRGRHTHTHTRIRQEKVDFYYMYLYELIDFN